MHAAASTPAGTSTRRRLRLGQVARSATASPTTAAQSDASPQETATDASGTRARACAAMHVGRLASAPAETAGAPSTGTSEARLATSPDASESVKSGPSTRFARGATSDSLPKSGTVMGMVTSCATSVTATAERAERPSEATRRRRRFGTPRSRRTRKAASRA